MRMKNVIFTFLIGFIISFLISPSINVEASLTETVFPVKQTTDAYKPWTITFNQKVENNTIDDQTIYILDEKQKKKFVDFRYSDDGMSVTIVPDSAYVEGILYTIVVTDKVKNQNGKILSKTAKRPFIYFSNSEELKLGWDAKLRMQEIDKATGNFFIQWSIPPVKNIVGYHAYTRLEGHNEDGVTRPILDQNGQKVLIENNSGYFTLNRAIESNKMYGFAVSVVYKDGTESQMSQMNSVIYYNNDKKPPAEDNTSISTIEKAVLD